MVKDEIFIFYYNFLYYIGHTEWNRFDTFKGFFGFRRKILKMCKVCFLRKLFEYFSLSMEYRVYFLSYHSLLYLINFLHRKTKNFADGKCISFTFISVSFLWSPISILGIFHFPVLREIFFNHFSTFYIFFDQY